MNEEIAKILNNNLGNRITLELAEGLYQSIIRTVQAHSESKEDDTDGNDK